jgi:hypothetical protein
MPEMERMTLWDKQFRLVWDSDLRSAMRDPKLGPAYEAVNEVDGWVNAVIYFTDGTRWTGQLFRCPEGIKRFSREDLSYFSWPVNPLLPEEVDHA